MSIVEVNVQTGKIKTRKESAAEIEARQSERAKIEIQKTYDDMRREEFEKKEMAGELPATPHDNIDEIWKALEALAAGDNLPATAVDIIRTRKDIKARFPKG